MNREQLAGLGAAKSPYSAWGVQPELLEQVNKIETELRSSEQWQRLRGIREFNQIKVLAAFREARISEAGFAGSSGYGYDDLGRERLEQAFARIMGAEKALLRIQISAGTQAIAIALFACLRPGDLLLSATGLPYDTLYKVIGIDAENGTVQESAAAGRNVGSLADFGVRFESVSLKEDGMPDLEALAIALRRAKSGGRAAKMLYIQRSRGYSKRPAYLRQDIESILEVLRRESPETIAFVDNCYGEFTDYTEPNEWGADLCAGSLIKNPGGGIAPTGGYICGRADLVELAANRLTSPGLGAEVGPSLGFNRLLTQGLYLAPHVVVECLKGLSLSAAVFGRAGLMTSPAAESPRGDIIQTVEFQDAKSMIDFCRSVQAAAPVDAYVEPEPALLPGYSDEVIMAAGAFIQGSSIELSADGPVCPPYMAYMQGGLVYEQVKLATLTALTRMGITML